LFGGGGHNDLWEFDTKAKTWTWVSGSSIGGNVLGVYGTQGVASLGNVPGQRSELVSWADKTGNFWIFGGKGLDSTGVSIGRLNDLWKFNPTTREWTWVSGSSTMQQNAPQWPGQPGIYGTKGQPSASNVPGGRHDATGWIDSAGNLWLFGGIGYDSMGTPGDLNDLWEFNPTTSEWTWVSGASTTPLNSSGGNGQVGVYGTQGVPAAGNVPGGRFGAVSWIDSAGNLWLFGGYGVDSTGSKPGDLNDLWEFDPAAKTWTWMSGADTVNAVGVYGTQGVAAAANVPGARYSAVSWTDSSSNLWLFGGSFFNPAATPQAAYAYLNDVWKFNAATKTWTWMSGADTPNALGVYGTQGVPAADNMPGARYLAVSWTDSSGDFWLFGGWYENADGAGTQIYFNDLWRYQP
jgi:N-acetylneuraminic acid mutarotase